MVKCPFCGFGNEDGALFCEQCKSDISNVAPAPATPPFAPPTPIPESIAPGEIIPMAAVEVSPDAPIMAAIVEDVAVAEVIPMSPGEEPIQAEVIEAVALEAAVVEPMVEAPPPPPMTEEPAPPPVAEAPAPAAPVAEAPPMVPETPPVTPAIVPEAASPVAPAAAAKPAAAGNTPIPPGASPKLVVQRGLKIGEEYAIFAGENYVGRADEKPVDIDLTFQEPEERVWCSRQHALMVYDDTTGSLTIEDLNSSNGTFVNRERVYPGQPRQLFVGNTIQIGTVHMRVKV